MKRFGAFALSVISVGAIGAAGAPVASAYTGTHETACSGVTFHYTGFGEGSHTVQETVYEDTGLPIWNRLTQVYFTFTGDSATDLVKISLPPGTHTVRPDAWVLDPPEGEKPHVGGFVPPPPTTVDCGPPPPPACPAGSVSMRWHYESLGSAGAWSSPRSGNCPGNVTALLQGMAGGLTVAAGQRVHVGYAFKAQNGPITVSHAQAVFEVRCAGGGTPSSGSWTVKLPTRTYDVTGGDWQPSGDQHSPVAYQARPIMPSFCGSGRVRLDRGGVFSASFG